VKVKSKSQIAQEAYEARIFEEHVRASKKREAKKSRLKGEADFPDHVKMICEVASVKRGRKIVMLAPVWVKLKEGTREEGRGIVDQELPEGFATKGIKLKLGDVVKFKLKPRRKDVFFTSKVRVRNQLPQLRNQLAEDLQNSMTFNPGATAPQKMDNKPAREVITVRQAAMKLAVTNMALTQWLEPHSEFTFVGIDRDKVWRPKDGREIEAGYHRATAEMETDEQANAILEERAKFEKSMASSRKEYMHWVEEFRIRYNLELK
jgi:hypothetical protein